MRRGTPHAAAGGVAGHAGRVLAAGVVLALLAAPAAAELRRLEAVGAVGVRDGERADPRQRAVEAALREAVSQVAHELLLEAELPMGAEAGGEGLPGEQGEAPDLEAILGDDLVAYTARFRIVEDRGIGPAMFIEDPELTREYVVVARVDVDTERVRQRLVDAGLLPSREGTGESREAVRLDVQGLEVYAAYEDLRDLLAAATGGDRGVPLRFEPGRVVIEVHTPLQAPALTRQLARQAPGHMQIVTLDAAPRSARIAVRWTRPDEPPAAVETRGPRSRRGR